MALSAPSVCWTRAYWLGLLGVVSVFYGPHLTRLPSGIHAWAQGDRLALAINFYDFGFDFWTPRTSSLTSRGGITGVEFPLQAYVAALGGLVFGRGAINVLFRLLDASLTLLGFYYLFRFVFERTQHFVAALVPGCFLLSSAVFAFYAGNYLPDPASLSLSFVAYYYWLRFFERRVFQDLVVGVVLLTLAALLKTTTALYLGALLGFTFGWAFFVPALLTARQRLVFTGLSGIAVAGVVLFFLHNRQLNHRYESGQFLASPRPVPDADALTAVLDAMRQKWGLAYATPVQYGLLAASVALLLFFARPSLRQQPALVFLLLAGGALGYGFLWLMGGQLAMHDYYAICSFMPPAVFGLLLGLLHLGRLGRAGRARYWGSSAGLALLCALLLRDGYQQLTVRMQEQTCVWLHGAPAVLARAGVGPRALLLVLDEAPNTPLVYLDHRGLSWNPSSSAFTAEALLARMTAKSLTYVVMPSAYYGSLTLEQQAHLAAAYMPIIRRPFVVLKLQKADLLLRP